MFPVRPAKAQALLTAMRRLGITEQDLVERFVRSSGPGGQHTNKASTCVYLKHVPTGLEVKCQASRSQTLNRYVARVWLVRKVEQQVLGRESEEQQRIEKLRRQKRKRSRRAKLRLVEAKRRHGAKKRLRAPLSLRDIGDA